MIFTPLALAGVWLIQPQVHGDERGYFMESFKQQAFEQAIGYAVDFCQDNESCSSFGVLRGLHFQLPPYAQAKLVRVIAGEVLDVAVDIRPHSATFGQHVAVRLSGENKRQLFIPKGFAHGFVVLSEYAITAYKVDAYHAPEHERGVAFDDPDLGIDWHLPLEQLKLSAKDARQPRLSALPYPAFD